MKRKSNLIIFLSTVIILFILAGCKNSSNTDFNDDDLAAHQDMIISAPPVLPEDTITQATTPESAVEKFCYYLFNPEDTVSGAESALYAYGLLSKQAKDMVNNLSGSLIHQLREFSGINGSQSLGYRITGEVYSDGKLAAVETTWHKTGIRDNNIQSVKTFQLSFQDGEWKIRNID